jgi:intraflagellar transport protein 52
MSGEGGDSKTGTNFNYMLEEYGIEVKSDSVVRSTLYKYFHPKVESMAV